MNRRLRQLRLSKGLTQQDLADKADVDKSTVYRVENLQTQPSPTTIRKLARALDVSPEELQSAQQRLYLEG